MSTDMQIDQMTLEEELRAMEALWNALCRNEGITERISSALQDR